MINMVNFSELRSIEKKIEANTSEMTRFFETSFFSTSPWLIPPLGPLDETEISEIVIKEKGSSKLEEKSKGEDGQIDFLPQENIENKERAKESACSSKIIFKEEVVCNGPLSGIIEVELPFPSQIERDIKVLFMGDTTDSGISFKADNSDMLGRMILAMDLPEGSFIRASGDEDVFETIAKYRPQVVVTLGAKATNLLLGRKEKLAKVHGKQFKANLSFHGGEKLEVNFIPVFHPDYLEINPAMKRSAWIDLQKVLEYLQC